MSEAPTKTPRLRLRVTAAAESAIRRGHPWLFSDSVRELNRNGASGELAVIFDRQNRFLAVGLFDPDSPLRVRILHVGKPVTLDAAWWRTRLLESTARRAGLFDAATTGHRWIHGESDGWPGLVLDRYDATLVLKLYSAAWLLRVGAGGLSAGEAAKPASPLPADGLNLVELLASELNPERLVLRLSRNIQDAAARVGLADGQTLRGPPPAGPIVFAETGLRFEAEVERGQKTGFFLDQRENRRLVETLAAGREVLNAFSFSGGFSLYAARGGARLVTDLDISPHALASARRNFALNQDDPRIRGCVHESVQADCFEWLASGPQRQFDLVILDPPSLARREHERAGAIQAYGRLAAGGIARLRDGGMLLASSCSAHVSADEFFAEVRQVAQSSGRPFVELRTTGQPPDHPATFPEAQYLKSIYLRF